MTDETMPLRGTPIDPDFDPDEVVRPTKPTFVAPQTPRGMQDEAEQRVMDNPHTPQRPQEAEEAALKRQYQEEIERQRRKLQYDIRIAFEDEEGQVEAHIVYRDGQPVAIEFSQQTLTPQFLLRVVQAAFQNAQAGMGQLGLQYQQALLAQQQNIMHGGYRGI